MIDIFQWRASIGLWNCFCPNGVKGERGSSGGELIQLKLILSFIIFLLILAVKLYCTHVPSAGVLGTCAWTGNDVTDMKGVWSLFLTMTDCTTLVTSLVFLLLLLSGDVELNPGPTILDSKPDIRLLLEWLEPLTDWQSFGLLGLHGIKRADITEIKKKEVKVDRQKEALFKKWLEVNPKGTWRNVIVALKKRNEDELAQNIERHLQTSSSQLFINFKDANNLRHIISSFSQLCQVINLDQSIPGHQFYSSLKERLQHWKCKELWKVLDKRADQLEYFRSKEKTVRSSEEKRVLIVGAGPVGLRSAIEAALLGAEVDLVEKRDNFSRNNALHLWRYLIDDLNSLGVKIFYSRFGLDYHISIRVLQCVLLKICLVLGVKVHFSVTFQDLIEPQSDSDGWRVSVEPTGTPASTPVSAHLYDAIITAAGKQYCLPQFDKTTLILLRGRDQLAIAVTANFVNYKTPQEYALEEFGGIRVSNIDNPQLDSSLREHGIELDNIVYFRDETHYFIMTASRRSLLKRGVIKKDDGDLLSKENIDQAKLESFAKDVATLSTKAKSQDGVGLVKLDFAKNHRKENDIGIFGFDSLSSSTSASRIMERKGKRILLCTVGDSLLEPYWPTGSGIGKGFLAALDSAWMLKRFSEGVELPLELIKEREKLLQLLKFTTSDTLRKETDYTIDPSTRYDNAGQIRSVRNVSCLYDTDTNTRLLKRKREEIEAVEATGASSSGASSSGVKRRKVKPEEEGT